MGFTIKVRVGDRVEGGTFFYEDRVNTASIY